MSPALKIAAVFATMNRAATAVACVRALAVQSRPPDLVIVADNVSNDDTVAALEAMADLPFPLIVHRMDENRGNAGGVKEVMEMAFAEGVDAVWILDDDSWPRAAALEAMLDGPWDPQVVRHPLQIDPRTNQFTWPLQVTDGKGGWRLISNVAELPDGECVRSRISWTGALLSREVREAIGPVNGDLFIRGEDEEYPLRMEQGGFPQEARRGAVMDHPGPQNLICWTLLGKSFFFEPGLSDWKIYYKVRNMVWIKRKQSGNRRAILMATVYALAAFQIDGIGRLTLIFSAAWDGWRGNLGKWKGHPS
ncbi:MAG: glycosyltransferase [Akkermansiaceae bacterium]|nr:glycosyltransferase [Akkermansiaceae bacterium]